jgi:hypothetical protein
MDIIHIKDRISDTYISQFAAQIKMNCFMMAMRICAIYCKAANIYRIRGNRAYLILLDLNMLSIK